MLVDPDTGHLCAVSHLALAAHRERTDRADANDRTDGEFGAEAGLEQELFLQQIETGTAPFVDVGDTVKKGQVLCIIEAMKLMNEIDCEYDGEIVNVYVENGQPVQYGERLFAIRTK